MLKTPGWNKSNMPISALAPYYEQYFVVNPTQEMLPNYVWERLAVYATIPRNTNNFRLYSTGQGKDAQTFDQGRAIVLPEDVNVAGLSQAIVYAEAFISAYAAAKGNPGARTALADQFRKAAGDPSKNPLYIVIVNGALEITDPDNPPLGTPLDPEVAKVLGQWGGEMFAARTKAVTIEGEGGGVDSVRTQGWEMPWLTTAILNTVGAAPALQGAAAVKSAAKVGGIAAGAPSDALGYALLEFGTGQKTLVGSAAKQNMSRDFATQRRIMQTAKSFKPAGALLPSETARAKVAEELAADITDRSAAYYDGTNTPAFVTALASQQEGQAAREMFDTWQEWAKVRGQVQIPAEQSNIGTFEQFYTVYRDRAASGASQSDLKNLMAELDYGKYTQ
jgi:hypothetical protein